MDTISTTETEVVVSGGPALVSRLMGASFETQRQFKNGKRAVGLLVQREARRLCPYLEGNLERGISFEDTGEGVRIFVPLNHPAGQYAAFIHNGTYALGRLSREKGPDIGPKYITRAITPNIPKIILLLKPAIGSI